MSLNAVSEQTIKDILKSQYNNAANYYDSSTNAFIMRSRERFRSRLIKELKDLPVRSNEQVLDVACGTGLGLFEFVQLFPHTTGTGVDLSPGMLQVAQAKAAKLNLTDRIRFEVGDAEKLSFPDESFSIGLLIAALHLIPNKIAALSELHRVLKPGGIGFLSLFGARDNCAELMTVVLPRILGNYLGAEGARQATSPWQPPTITEMDQYMQDVGFKDYWLTLVREPFFYGTFDDFFTALQYQYGFWRTALSLAVMEAVKKDLEIEFKKKAGTQGYPSEHEYIVIRATR